VLKIITIYGNQKTPTPAATRNTPSLANSNPRTNTTPTHTTPTHTTPTHHTTPTQPNTNKTTNANTNVRTSNTLNMRASDDNVITTFILGGAPSGGEKPEVRANQVSGTQFLFTCVPSRAEAETTVKLDSPKNLHFVFKYNVTQPNNAASQMVLTKQFTLPIEVTPSMFVVEGSNVILNF